MNISKSIAVILFVLFAALQVQICYLCINNVESTISLLEPEGDCEEKEEQRETMKSDFLGKDENFHLTFHESLKYNTQWNNIYYFNFTQIVHIPPEA
jgi:hypothetical protein